MIPNLRTALAFAAGSLCTAPAVVGQLAKDLAPPVRLDVGGKPIDTGSYIAHSGPLLCDYDGNGKLDLLVGNFKGHIQVYRNVGSNQVPKFEDKGLLQAEGEPIFIHNW